MWPSDEGSRPRGQRRRTADPTGRLPPGIWVSGMASGHRSTDSNGAGRQKAPGLQSPQRRHQGEARREPPITTRPGTGWPPKGPEALRGEEVMGGIRRCWVPGDTTAGRCGDELSSSLHRLTDPIWGVKMQNAV
ncbi:hypothetical protein PENNAL_c0597G05221, partial [Penicillium nalgiovense]